MDNENERSCLTCLYKPTEWKKVDSGHSYGRCNWPCPPSLQRNIDLICLESPYKNTKCYATENYTDE